PMLSSQPLRPLPARALLPYTPLFRSRTPSGGPPPAPPKAPGCLPAPGAHGPARVRDRRSRSGAGFPPLHKPADPLEFARGKGPLDRKERRVGRGGRTGWATARERTEG